MKGEVLWSDGGAWCGWQRAAKEVKDTPTIACSRARAGGRDVRERESCEIVGGMERAWNGGTSWPCSCPL